MYVLGRLRFFGLFLLGACNLAGNLNTPVSQSTSGGQKKSDQTSINTNDPNLVSSSLPPSQAFEGQRYSAQVVTNLSANVLVEFENKPSWLNYDRASGVVSGVPSQIETLRNFRVIATRGDLVKTLGPVSIEVKGDPLKEFAWHLKNTGQTSFANQAGSAGFDLNLNSSLASGLTGKGVKIAVSDSGTEHFHPDLQPNYIAEMSRHYRRAAPAAGADGKVDWTGDPAAPRNDDTVTEPSHGTAVAGIIAAKGWNGIGSRGIAPDAKFAAFNFIPSGCPDDDESCDPNAASRNITSTQTLDQITGNFDVFNQSFGSEGDYFPGNGSYTNFLLYEEQLRTQTQSVRGGKGSLYVKAAGNSYDYNSVYPGFTEVLYNVASDGFDRQNRFHIAASLDLENNSPYIIAVGANAASGVKSSYSSIGANLWVSAPGGEDGFRRPAILTTDRLSCAKGYAQSGYSSLNTSAFDLGTFINSLGINLNPTCDYNASMNGTSSATPMTVGSIALILEANPSLNWRDVKYILAKTATQLEPTKAALVRPSQTFDFKTYTMNNNETAVTSSATRYSQVVSDPQGYVAVDAWRANAAGFKFHNFYGFGQVNVDAAVAMAKNSYQSPYLNKNFQSVTISSPNGTNLPIPNAGTETIDGVTTYTRLDIPVQVTNNWNVEAVRVQLFIDKDRSSALDDYASYPGEVGIELISPAGTVSKIQSVNNVFLGAQFVDASVGVNTPITSLNNRMNSGLSFDEARYGYPFDTEFPDFGMPQLSNAFFHESAAGTWRIRVIDGLASNFTYGQSGATVAARLQNFQARNITGRVVGYRLTLFGHAK